MFATMLVIGATVVAIFNGLPRIISPKPQPTLWLVDVFSVLAQPVITTNSAKRNLIFTNLSLNWQ
jgi:K+/H+ antiporter YhaU regulatory subunit KhtT